MAHSDTMPRLSIAEALSQKKHVMTAVILRDMRTRFFNHGLGFLLVSVWPLAHMVILLLVNTFAGRQAPYGENMAIFIVTGLVPTLTFNYISRFMSLSLMLNRPMLSFPVVSIIDIMVARAFLEIIASFLTLIFLSIILTSIGVDPFPFDPYQAAFAYLSTILLAVGSGTLAGIMVMIMPFFATIYALLMILVYLLSGVVFVVSSLPEPIAYILSWNPVLQCVEWMRTAYYPDYPDKLLDKTYVIAYGLTTLCLGLLLERILRMRMLEG